MSFLYICVLVFASFTNSEAARADGLFRTWEGTFVRHQTGVYGDYTNTCDLLLELKNDASGFSVGIEGGCPNGGWADSYKGAIDSSGKFQLENDGGYKLIGQLSGSSITWTVNNDYYAPWKVSAELSDGFLQYDETITYGGTGVLQTATGQLYPSVSQ